MKHIRNTGLLQYNSDYDSISYNVHTVWYTLYYNIINLKTTSTVLSTTKYSVAILFNMYVCRVIEIFSFILYWFSKFKIREVSVITRLGISIFVNLKYISWWPKVIIFSLLIQDNHLKSDAAKRKLYPRTNVCLFNQTYILRSTCVASKETTIVSL
jgi:hypothetical protein